MCSNTHIQKKKKEIHYYALSSNVSCERKPFHKFAFLIILVITIVHSCSLLIIIEKERQMKISLHYIGTSVTCCWQMELRIILFLFIQYSVFNIVQAVSKLRTDILLKNMPYFIEKKKFKTKKKNMMQIIVMHIFL